MLVLLYASLYRSNEKYNIITAYVLAIRWYLTVMSYTMHQ